MILEPSHWEAYDPSMIMAEDGIVHTFQLWMNLSGDKKMIKPRYQNLLSKDAPVRKRMVLLSNGTV